MSSEIYIILGVWNEDLHKEWYQKEGHKKRTETYENIPLFSRCIFFPPSLFLSLSACLSSLVYYRSVTHLYTDGDVCDITEVPRSCYVKFKSVY